MRNNLKQTLPRRMPAGAPALRPGSPRAKLVWRIGLGLAALLAIFAAVGFFVVPPVARYYLAKELSEQLGRQVTVEAVDVNPFSLVAVIKGLSIKERGASDVFASFGELKLDLQAESVYRRAPILREVKLINPYVHIVRNPDARTYNFSDLIAKFSASEPAPAKNPAEEPRFSVNNVQIVNGRVEIDDRPKHARHTVREINVAIPFLSNLPYRIEDYVQPSFSARVNEAPFSLQGRTKPFDDTLETSVDIRIEKLNISRYMEYAPIDLGFRVPSGLLDSRLTVSFVRSEHRPPLLSVTGSVELHQFSLAELDGKPLLSLQELSVPIDRIDVFGRKYELGKIALQSPEVFVRRDHDGSLNWLAAVPKREAPEAGTRAQPAEPIALSVAEMRITDGQVHVTDLVPETTFKTNLSDIQASLRNVVLPQSVPAQAELVFGTSRGERVKYAGSLSLAPLASEGAIEATRIRLVDYQPYYRDFILYRLEDGIADLATHYNVTATQSGPQVKLTGFNLNLASVRMRKPGKEEDFLRARSAQIRDASVDLSTLALTVGDFSTRDGFLNVIRESDGTINATRILPAPKEASTAGRQGTPWLLTLKRADIQKWRVAFTDLTPKEPVHMVADDFTLSASDLTNLNGRRGRIDLSAKLNRTGRLTVKGPVAINPIIADLKLDLKDVGLVPLQPYFADRVNVLVTSADLSVTGSTRLAVRSDGRPAVRFDGEATLANFASVDKAKSEDFLKWGTLFVDGINYNHDPLRLDIDQAVVSDFYSRIIIYPEGRLNLQEIATRPPGETAGATQTSPDVAIKGPAPAVTAGRGSSAPVAPAKSGVAQTPAAPHATSAPPPISIGKVVLQGGNVNFTDLFIKPNYSASLSEIGGAVTGLSSRLDSAADVDLRGRFARTAPVEIKGKINPLVHNLFLDLKANVRDIELGPFTPYSGKYVGYAIEKGKLAFNVAYKIEDRKLAASNQIVVDQLTFGGKVESPQATKLPVMLAVALLKDRNGVIDVNLPISGSLDDPKFSIGSLIVRVIVNLVTKAVTAPFALLGNLAGGGDGAELSYVEFDPGRSVLTAKARDKLGTLEKGLIDRPALKLDITPRVDPTADREGLRRYRFEQQIKAQKLKELVEKGEAVKSVDAVKIEPQEYEKYLRRAYRDADFPRPRNFIGLLKDLPAEEMEKLMLANTQVSNDDLVQLANQRGQAAKDFLTRSGEVALERVFLVAPKLEPSKPDAEGQATRVDFALK